MNNNARRKLKRKNWHDKRTKKLSILKSRKKKRPVFRVKKFQPVYKTYESDFVKKEIVLAPQNLCLLTNTTECLRFFSKIRSEKIVSKSKSVFYIQISFENVVEIDYSTVCILIAIIGDLNSKGIFTRSNLSKDEKCKKDIIDSGLLNSFYDLNGKRFKKAESSDLLFIEKGSKKLSRTENIAISNKVRNVVYYLTGEKKHNKKLRKILLEICGNSIEWGGTKNRQWLIGLKYEEEKVIFTITDVGKGILRSLHRKFGQKLYELFGFKTDIEVLRGAFIKKYESSSKQVNRNKGLPAIKSGFDVGLIEDLKVLTNNVILHYDDDDKSGLMKNANFEGTLYRWIVTRDSLKYDDYGYTG